MAIIVIFSALYQRNPQTGPKKQADTYFSFSEGFALANATDDQLKIMELSFNITAAEGDATEVTIQPPGNVAREDWPYFSLITKGESKTVYVTYTYPLYLVTPEKEPNGWPLSFRIICSEAEGDVTVYITDYFQSP